MSAVWRSPPRVKRVIGDKGMLPNLDLAHRSNARRRPRHRQEEVDLSSPYLAAAIGCPIPIPVDSCTPAAMSETGRAAADQDAHDEHRSAVKTDSIGSLFRMGLELGQKRSRGAGVV